MYESAGKGPFWLWLVFFLVSIVVAYLLGSINSAIIISKIFYGDDIRKHGSDNTIRGDLIGKIKIKLINSARKDGHHI